MKASDEPIAGPRSLRDPRSREYAIQTIRSLKRHLESKSLDAKGVERELEEIKRHKHWQVLGFKSLDAYLQAEVGITHKQLERRLAQDLAADPTVQAAAPAKTAGPGRGKTVAISHGLSSLGGDSAERIIRRLKRDAPDIAAALARGEYRSARAAGIAAGIIKLPTALKVLRKAWAKAPPDDQAEFFAEVAAEMAQRAERERAA